MATLRKAIKSFDPAPDKKKEMELALKNYYVQRVLLRILLFPLPIPLPVIMTPVLM